MNKKAGVFFSILIIFMLLFLVGWFFIKSYNTTNKMVEINSIALNECEKFCNDRFKYDTNNYKLNEALNISCNIGCLEQSKEILKIINMELN